MVTLIGAITVVWIILALFVAIDSWGIAEATTWRWFVIVLFSGVVGILLYYEMKSMGTITKAGVEQQQQYQHQQPQQQQYD